MSTLSARVSWQGDLKFVGTNPQGLQTHFESSLQGEEASASSPMEILLQTMGACSGMDVVSILEKMRKTVEKLEIEIRGEREDTHPRVFTEIFVRYILTSPNALLGDLTRAVELSLSKYCPIAVMLQRAGVTIHHEVDVINPLP